LHVGISEDGFHFTDTSAGAGNYTPPVGELRDPKIIYRAGTFYCFYSCFGIAKDSFGIASSTDGITWTFLRNVVVDAPGIDTGSTRYTAGAVPFVDPDTGDVYCSVNCADSVGGGHYGAFLAKATSSDFSTWSGTGVGSAAWALATVSGMPGGYTPGDVDVQWKDGSTYYAAITNDNASVFVATATNFLGTWTVVNAADDLNVFSFGLESSYLWRSGTGEIFQLASAQNLSFYRGQDGGFIRSLGTDITDLRNDGDFSPLSMDYRITQGLDLLRAKLPRAPLRALGSFGGMAVQDPQHVTIWGGTIKDVTLGGDISMTAPEITTGRTIIPTDDSIFSGPTVGGLQLNGVAGSSSYFLQYAGTNELFLFFPSTSQGFKMFDHAGGLLHTWGDDGKVTLGGGVTANGVYATGFAGLPAGGTGGLRAELGVSGGAGYFQAYNRTTSAYAQTRINGSTILLSPDSGGTTTIGASGAALTHLRHGTTTLVAGVKVVSDTTITANTRILVTRNGDGGTIGCSYSITRSAGVSFTITSKDSAGATQTADTSTMAYELIEP
jgi:hypothetical protein